MDYLLKASGILIILFLFYHLLLRKETFFTSIRSYFLAGLGIVLLFPLIEIPVYIDAVAQKPVDFMYTNVQEAVATTHKFDWNYFLTFIYLGGVLFFLGKFLTQLFSLVRLLLKHPIKKIDQFYFVKTSKNISPFSFFNIIIFNETQFTIEELQLIIHHEKAHAKQWHSFDTLLTHLLVITFWFNPFVWLYKKAVLQNLEFLADAYAFKNAENEKLYQLTLLKTCSNQYCTQLTNNFYNSLIKKRIVMLHKTKSNNLKQWKYALLVPILLVFAFTFNTKLVAQNKEVSKNIEVTISKIELIIDKNTTKTELEAERATFKEEFDISLNFKGIKRNANNEITAIKIAAKGKNSNAQFQNSGTTPIQPIRISFDDNSNSISIGNVKKHTKNLTYKVHKNHDIHSDKNNKYVIITSDESGNNWTSVSGDTIIHKDKIIVKSKGDDEHIWIAEKNDNKKVTIEVIELENGKKKVKVIERDGAQELTEDIKIEILDDENIFIIKEDDASENVIVLEKDKKPVVVKSKDKKIFFTNSGNSPLIFIDGKEVNQEAMDKLDPNSIESINVLKGVSAEKKYGDKAKDGVIEIQTKKE